MARFFIDNMDPEGKFLVLTGENAAHAKVLRLKCGESVTVCDGNGKESLCTVSDISNGQIGLIIDRTMNAQSEASVKVSVYMAFAKGDKLEHVLQKATELGAYEIIAFPSSRCVSRPDEKSLTKKLERWKKIAAAAAEQSGRGRIPNVLVLNSYIEALEHALLNELAIVFYENEHSTTLKSVLTAAEYASVSLLTGPEGGFEPEEIEQAVQLGLSVCTLGRRILRCETAPLCALSAVMYDSGEF